MCSRQAVQHGPRWTKEARHRSPKIKLQNAQQCNITKTKDVYLQIKAQLSHLRHCHLLGGEPEETHIKTMQLPPVWIATQFFG